MNCSRAVFLALTLLTPAACKHPLAIVGEGDIVNLVDGSGTYGCTLEQFQASDPVCTGYDFTADYIVNYEGQPKPGWRFSHWEGPCRPDSEPPYCTISAPIAWAQAMDGLGYGDSVPTTTAVFVENTPPVADAGPDQTVSELATVILDGSGNSSSDDGVIDSYTWTQTSGVTVLITDEDQATAGFTAPSVSVATVLVFELLVTDDDGAQASDSTTITVNPLPPTAHAGSDQAVTQLSEVALDGRGSVAGGSGSISSYMWRQTGGTTVLLNDATSATPFLNAPSVSAMEELEFELTVTDDRELYDSDTVRITVNGSVSSAVNYTYDAVGRLISASYSDGSAITYTYDANGNMLARTITQP